MPTDSELRLEASRIYSELLVEHLRAYRSGEPYGRMLTRDCGHVSWQIVSHLACIGCASSLLDSVCAEAP